MLLARTLGRTVAELEATMSAQEFGDWQAEYARQPWGDYAADLRAAVIASTIANVHRGSKAKPYRLTDFMPLQRQPDESQDDEETDSREFLEELKNNG